MTKKKDKKAPVTVPMLLHAIEKWIARTHEQVPISVIAPLIVEWEVEYKSKSQGAGSYIDEDRYPDCLEILGFQCGLSARFLRRVKKGQVMGGRHKIQHFVDYISFSSADKIVCATVGPLAWHEPPLCDYYGPIPVAAYEKDYEGVDVHLPTSRAA